MLKFIVDFCHTVDWSGKRAPEAEVNRQIKRALKRYVLKGKGMFMQRQGLIVWLYSLKQAKMLRRFGNVHYVSKKLKYVVLYCNQDEVEEIIEKLNSYSFVKKVEPSYKPFIKVQYENAAPDKAKEYDYKMGI